MSVKLDASLPVAAAAITKPTSFRPDIEGLRAVAVLAVFADHLFEFPAGGFVGVDIFFVISGFLITDLLIRERSSTGRISFTHFYIRRIRRILPMAMLVLAVTAAVSWLVLPVTRSWEALKDGLWAAAFMANWRFLRTGTDYFEEGQPPSPLQHYWSLAVEEQFYFVWPLVILAVFWLFSRRWLPLPEPNVRQGLALVVGLVVIASFLWSIVETHDEPTSAYFSTFTRGWELSVGALIAVAVPLLSRITSVVSRIAIGYIGLAGVAGSLFLVNSETSFPGPAAALPVASSALIMASFCGAKVVGTPILTNPISRYFGRISFSLYLWHWPVIILLAGVIETNFGYYLLVTGVSVLLSDASYRFVENPIRRSRWLQPARTPDSHSRVWLWPSIGVATVAAVALASVGVHMVEKKFDGPPVLEITRALSECSGAAALDPAKPRCRTIDFSGGVTPSRSKFQQDTKGGFDCWRPAGAPAKPCTYGSERPDAKRLALVGDSHAAGLLPGLKDELLVRNWSLTVFVGNGCQWKDNASNCVDGLKTTMSALETGDPFDAVLTTAYRKWGGGTPEGHLNYASAWQRVTDRGVPVFVVADNPWLPKEAIDCLSRLHAAESGKCVSSRADALAQDDALVRAQRVTPGTTLIDLTDYFCTMQECPAVIGGVIAYRDRSGHITATYSHTLGPYLAAEIDAGLAISTKVGGPGS